MLGGSLSRAASPAPCVVTACADERTVSVYRSRYYDFPKPVIDLGQGRRLLWLRADVEAWRDR